MSTLRVSNLQDTSGGNTSTPAAIANGIAKAWVNFNGTGAVAIRGSYNVSSITDNGTGNYTVNFTSALTDANYCVTGLSDTASTANAPRSMNINASGSGGVAPTSSAVKVCTGADSTNFVDISYIFVAIFR